nr:MAG: maturation protein [Leviviridae sp.]
MYPGYEVSDGAQRGACYRYGSVIQQASLGGLMSDQRTRTLEDLSQTMWTTSTQVNHSSDGTDTTSTTDRSYMSDNVVTTTIDVVTPNFHRRIANGEIINNYFSSTMVHDKPVKATAHNRVMKATASGTPRGWYGTTTSGEIAMADSYKIAQLSASYSSEMVAARQSVIDSAVQKAYANIDVSEMLALATAFESRKTVDFFRDTLKRLYRIMKAVRKLDIQRVAKEFSPKELEARYMELRYAIRPLIYDANGLIAALDKTSRHYDRFTARGYDSTRVAASDVVTNQVCGWYLSCDWNRTFSYEVSARAGVLSHVQMTDLQIFGVDQLLETGWELLPFSFIVDWFVNVGQALAAATPNAGVTQLASWVTVKEAFTATNKMVNVRSTRTGFDIQNTVSWSAEYGQEINHLERIVDPALNIWPTVGVSLDMFKILDLGIILKNVLR